MSLSTTSALGDPGSHAFAVDEGRDMTRAFRVAARHSRRVRKLRVAIPVTIVFILGATILVSWLDPLKVLVRLPIDSGKIVISGTKITMEAPKLSGYTRDRRWYEMNAKAAAQDVTKPDLVELAEIRAKIETADKSTIYLSSKDGLYNRKTSILTLNNNVLIRSTSGFEMHLDEAVVDTANGEVVSNKPVAAFTADSTLNSDRLEIQKSGEIVYFIGSVVMNIDNVKKPQQAAPTTQPTAAKR
jgi:lipopolysaccharide export system protein LptC